MPNIGLCFKFKAESFLINAGANQKHGLGSRAYLTFLGLYEANVEP